VQASPAVTQSSLTQIDGRLGIIGLDFCAAGRSRGPPSAGQQ
jgi:hypothetical protein